MARSAGGLGKIFVNPKKMDIAVKSPKEAARRLWSSVMLPFELPSFDMLMRDEDMGWIPRADYSETDKELKVMVDIPNVDPKNVSVEVDDHSLVISGTTEEESREEGETWYRSERSWGKFKRVFGLPSNADLKNVKAETKNGTICVRVPKLESDMKRKVTVERG